MISRHAKAQTDGKPESLAISIGGSLPNRDIVDSILGLLAFLPKI